VSAEQLQDNDVIVIESKYTNNQYKTRPKILVIIIIIITSSNELNVT